MEICYWKKYFANKFLMKKILFKNCMIYFILYTSEYAYFAIKGTYPALENFPSI